MDIKYSKNALWLKPYVDSVSDLIPLNKIYRIKGYQVRVGCEEKKQGMASQITKTKHVITIRMWDLTEDRKKHRRRLYYHVLETVAHELSHLVYWEHTASHFRLTAQVLIRFSDIIEQQGILDTSKQIDRNLIMNKVINLNENM